MRALRSSVARVPRWGGVLAFLLGLAMLGAGAVPVAGIERSGPRCQVSTDTVAKARPADGDLPEQRRGLMELDTAELGGEPDPDPDTDDSRPETVKGREIHPVETAPLPAEARPARAATADAAPRPLQGQGASTPRGPPAV
jgi:hypothetical protein